MEKELETSWQGLLAHLRRVTSAPGSDERLKLDMACVASAWCAIRRRLARRGIRQVVVNPGSWCSSSSSTLTCTRSSGWSQSIGSNLFE